jgi:hypothetical protein
MPVRACVRRTVSSYQLADVVVRHVSFLPLVASSLLDLACCCYMLELNLEGVVSACT